MVDHRFSHNAIAARADLNDAARAAAGLPYQDSDIRYLLSANAAMTSALKNIAQRANESGTGEMSLTETIHAVHGMAIAAMENG